MFRDKSIQVHQINFESAITRIELDLFTSDLWITQNNEEDSIQFFNISISDAFKRQKLNFEFKKKNFVLNSVHNDFLIVSKIIDPGKPDENEIWIIDAKSDKVLDTLKGFRFLGFKTDSILQVEKSGYEKFRREDIDLGPYRSYTEPKTEKLLQPQLYLPKNELFESISLFLNKALNKEVIAPFDLLEYNQLIFICVHIQEKDSMSKQLLIINSEAEVIFKNILYENLQKRMPDSFFVYGNFLIFVSRLNELNILNINPDNAS